MKNVSKKPLLSVIVPVYNVEDYLAECLDSIEAQTFQNFEVIAVNDGSTDGSERILNFYANMDERIRVVNQPNAGQSAARNAGMSIAEGEYIFFLDGDDVLSSDAFEKVVERAEESGADVVVYDYYLLDNETGAVSYFRDQELYARLNGSTFTIEQAPELIQYVGVWDKLFKRKFIEENNLRFPEGKVYEDHLFSIAAELAAKKIALMSDHIYYWRRNVSGSTTNKEQGSAAHRCDFLFVQKCAQEELEKADASEELWGFYAKYFLGYAYMHQRHIGSLSEFKEFFAEIQEIAYPKLTRIAKGITHSQVIFYKNCLDKNKPELAFAYMKSINAAHVPYEAIRTSAKKKKLLCAGMIDATGNRLQFPERPSKFMSFEGTHPIISLLIPCYNVENYLAECLDSVMAQDLQQFEAICINDGSTDSTLNIIKDYCEKDARFRLIDKPNSGYGASMNSGLEAAKGEYVAILESDDTMEPAALASLVSAAKQNDADAVKSNFFFYWTTPNVRRQKNNLVLPEHRKVVDPKSFPELFWFMPSIWSAIYSRDFLNKNNIRFLETPGASYQDVSFTFKVWAKARKVALLQDAFVNYRQDNESSSINSPGKVFCICDEFEEIERFLQEDTQLQCLKKTETRFKFDCYIWNFKRLSPELRQEFLPRFYEEFLKEEALGNIDYPTFWPWNEADCRLLLRDPIKFLQEENKCDCKHGSASQLFRYLKAGGPGLLKRRLRVA